MDRFDRAVMRDMAEEAGGEQWWQRDTIYPGSVVLTAEGRTERDRRAGHLRDTLGGMLASGNLVEQS